MKLKALFKNIQDVVIQGSPQTEVRGIGSHSKKLSSGTLFIAKVGNTHDGAHFLKEAERAGAAAVLTPYFYPDLTIPQVIHPNVRQIESEVTNRFYGFPSQKLEMIGITGTNGKTTTSWIVRHLLESFGISCGVIGSIEYRIGQKSYAPTHTTPDVAANLKLLSEMVQEGCKACVMEVTSHALDQGRVNGIEFGTAIFTNLTPEHLDYHKSMEEYLRAKQKLFDSLQDSARAVLNADDPYAKKISCTNPMTFGLNSGANLYANQIELTPSGTYFQIAFGEEKIKAFLPLAGRFNLSNALGAMAALVSPERPLKKLISSLGTMPQIPGRLQRVGKRVYVDYAHTEDALEKALKTLSEFKKGKIFTVFGCGGDRDQIKRPNMAKVSEEYSDETIVTTDNPRSEDPEVILDEICAGFSPSAKFERILDRKSAIKRAIFLAGPKDLILIAGKGHETIQQFSHHTVEFSDVEVAKECL